MATETKEKKPAQRQDSGKKAEKRDRGEKRARGPHAGAGLPVPAPRLRGFYNETVRAKLASQFGFKNPHQIPTIEKIVINVGLGEAIKQPRMLDGIVDELATITGQQPV